MLQGFIFRLAFRYDAVNVSAYRFSFLLEKLVCNSSGSYLKPVNLQRYIRTSSQIYIFKAIIKEL